MLSRAYEARGWTDVDVPHTALRELSRGGTAALVPELERGDRGADTAELSEDDRGGRFHLEPEWLEPTWLRGTHTHTHVHFP